MEILYGRVRRREDELYLRRVCIPAVWGREADYGWLGLRLGGSVGGGEARRHVAFCLGSPLASAVCLSGKGERIWG